MENDLQIRYLGTVPYERAFRQQLKLHAQRVGNQIPDTLLLLEHPHVFTLGRHANDGNLLWNASKRAEKGVELRHVDRGGDVTYHGPGQLVGYPIIKLTQRGLLPKRLVEWVENTIIRTLASFHIQAYVPPDHPGVWVEDAKICAIGMRIREGVSYHGFALNVNTDLAYFSGIIPCGIADKKVCSMASILGKDPDIDAVREALVGIALSLLPQTADPSKS
jgi:lipoyl(octanoyl) transferase